MNTERHTLIAFISVLVAIVLLVITAAILCAMRRPYEAIGVGGAVTGLIGVLGTFRPSKPGTTVGSAGTVNSGAGTTAFPQSTTEGE